MLFLWKRAMARHPAPSRSAPRRPYSTSPLGLKSVRIPAPGGFRLQAEGCDV